MRNYNISCTNMSYLYLSNLNLYLSCEAHMRYDELP